MINNKSTRNKKPMAWKEIGIVALLALIMQPGLEARLRFIGPNPYYSFLTFPQDSRLFTLNSTFSFFYYRNRGWMGHLDFPEMSPSPTYVNTEESAEVSVPSGQTARVGFDGSWISPEIMAVPYVFEFKSIRIVPLVSGKLDSFSLSSSGLAVPYENKNAVIPFSSELSQKNREMSVGVLMSASMKHIPIGILFNYRYFTEGKPSGYIRFAQEGQERQLNRYNWGWSTVNSCNHIFGVKTNIDAFWQDAYINSEGSQIDLVVGADVKENKFGFRFRQLREYGDEYSYSADVNQYLKDPYRRKASKTFLRASELFKILSFENANLYLCTVAEADFLSQRHLASGVELMDSYKEKAYALEFLPILHFDLDSRGGFFRIGTSASFFWKDYAYKDVWGKQEVYSPGWASFGWETSWERSSYGNVFSFINFTEADVELPLIERWNLLLSLDVWSHLVFSRTKRFYGDNVREGDAYRFVKEAQRKNTLRETWFGGTFGLIMGKRISYGVFIDLPVYYDKFVGTEIQQAADFFKANANAQPAIRKPVSLWALVIMRW